MWSFAPSQRSNRAPCCMEASGPLGIKVRGGGNGWFAILLLSSTSSRPFLPPMLYLLILVVLACMHYSVSAGLQLPEDAGVRIQLPKRSSFTKQDGTFDHFKAVKHTTKIVKCVDPNTSYPRARLTCAPASTVRICSTFN